MGYQRYTQRETKCIERIYIYISCLFPGKSGRRFWGSFELKTSYASLARMQQSAGLGYACFFLLFNVATTVTSHPLCNVLNSDTGLHKQHAGKLLGSIRKAIQDSNVVSTCTRYLSNLLLVIVLTEFCLLCSKAAHTIRKRLCSRCSRKSQFVFNTDCIIVF